MTAVPVTINNGGEPQAKKQGWDKLRKANFNGWNLSEALESQVDRLSSWKKTLSLTITLQDRVGRISDCLAIVTTAESEDASILQMKKMSELMGYFCTNC